MANHFVSSLFVLIQYDFIQYTLILYLNIFIQNWMPVNKDSISLRYMPYYCISV